MIGFGIAGTGAMAETMARAIALSDDAQLVRVASATPDRAAACAARWKAPAHGDFQAMLDDPAVDAIYIASRNADHARQSIAALAAGKPVLCEKPFAMNPAEAEAVIAAARSSGTLYMEAVATPFLPVIVEALAIVRSSRLGAVQRIEASMGYKVTRESHPRLFEADGGVLADRAVYPLMLALIFLGAEVGYRVEVERDGDIDVSARFALTHAGGTVSILSVSFFERLGNCIELVCADGVLDIAPPLLSARRLGIGKAKPFGGQLRQNPLIRRMLEALGRWRGGWHPYGVSPYLPELEHFCGLLRDGTVESPVVSHARMLECVRLIDQARAA